MPVKKKKRKNSNMKRLTRVSQYRLKDIAIVFTGGDLATFTNIKTLKQIKATPDMVTAATGVQHKWESYIAVMSETSLGEQYYTIAHVKPERACRQHEIEETLTEAHVKLISSTKLADRKNVGWVTVPSGKQLDDAKVRDLLETQNAWDKCERGADELKIKSERDRDLKEQIRLLERVA